MVCSMNNIGSSLVVILKQVIACFIVHWLDDTSNLKLNII